MLTHPGNSAVGILFRIRSVWNKIQLKTKPRLASDARGLLLYCQDDGVQTAGSEHGWPICGVGEAIAVRSVSIAGRTFVVRVGIFRNIVDVFSGAVESLGESLKQ
jgi:hypothetical protein